MRPLEPRSLARPTALLFLLFLLTSWTGCGGGDPVTLRFDGLVGSEPAQCGGMYGGIGTTATDVELSDFRLYVHDVRLVTEDGREVPVTIDADGVFQSEGVALLDFEDGTAGCENGTTQMNDTITGTVDNPGPFTGVRFRVGVPFEDNHADATTAPSPLNLTSMFWGWNGGYKFFRVDGRSTGQPGGFKVHLGSTGCDGDARGNVTTCANPNVPEIELTGFDPETSRIAVDLAALLSASDLDTDAGGMPGCMSAPDDPDCATIFDGLGLPFGGTASSGQQLFRVE
jgi:uncharacterized repeat protein (TIGR04052 family)